MSGLAGKTILVTGAAKRIGRQLQASPYHLERTFKRHLGITPRQYADALRLNRLKSDLRNGQDVTCALYDAGYGSSSRLYERAPEQLGMQTLFGGPA